MTYLSEKYKALGSPLYFPLALKDSGAPPIDFGLDLELESQNPLEHRPVEEIAPWLLEVPPKDTALWVALFAVFPAWRWGLQPRGDCTRWGKQHGADVLAANLYAAGKITRPEAQCAGESIYGFAKCELVNSYRYHGDGSTSWAVSEAAHKFGYLLRQLYEQGRDRIDLREETDYSGEWGTKGRGVPDWLEPYAAKHRMADRLDVADAMEAAKLITSGYPVDYAGYAPWPRTRDGDGMGTKFSRGAHMMELTGVRWEGEKPYAFWCANTGHGKHVSGPKGPIPVPDAYAECGGWIEASIVDKILRGGRCCAHTMVLGWPVLDLPDWGSHLYL
jgi:hypothetical protein